MPLNLVLCVEYNEYIIFILSSDCKTKKYNVMPAEVSPPKVAGERNAEQVGGV